MSQVWSSGFCILISSILVSTSAGQTAAPAQSQEQPAAKAASQHTPAPTGPRVRPTRPGATNQEEEDISKIPPPPGPMRILFHSLTETRIRAAEDVEGVPPSTLRLTATVTGQRLGEIVGVGGLVIEEMVDDTGNVLAKPEDVTELDRTVTQQVRVSARLMKRGSFQRTREIEAKAAREAGKLTKATGWVTLVYGGETEEILIDNPLQFAGGTVKNPRLEELGIQIEVVELGPEAQADERLGKGIGLRFASTRKQIRSIEFFDAWMRSVHPRERQVEPEGGEPYSYFPFTVGEADADTQMMLTVYKKIEIEQLHFDFSGQELP